MAELSPQAQAVTDAYHQRSLNSREWENGDGPRLKIAAALCAAAEQVVPEADTVDAEEWIGQSAWQQAEQSVRFRLLAIAAELEGK